MRCYLHFRISSIVTKVKTTSAVTTGQYVFPYGLTIVTLYVHALLHVLINFSCYNLLQKSAQQSSSIQSEHDAMQVKLAQSIQTVRGLTLERQRLEEENKRLIAEAHGYANTKLDEAEKKNESLREEVSEHKKKIADMTVKLNELDTQRAACEEKNRVMASTLKSLAHTKHNLEQKDVEQQAWIQNLQQV